MAVALGLAANPAVAYALPTGSLGQPISTGAGITPSPQMGAQNEHADASPEKPEADRHVDFEADEVDYSDDDNLVTAKGNVFLKRGERTMRADRWCGTATPATSPPAATSAPSMPTAMRCSPAR
jgi:LPS-assembly protein